MKTWYLKSITNGQVKIDDLHLVENRQEYKSNSFFKDTSGKVVIPIGGYLQLQEVEAPAEYVIDDTPFGFLTTETVKMEKKFPNTIAPCSIKLKKLNDNGSPLMGVEFKIEFLKESLPSSGEISKDYTPLLKVGESTTGTTDGNGMLIFSNLDQGTYRITETKTVEGNSLMKDPIEVTVPMTMTEAEAKSYGNVDFSTAKQDTNYTDKWFFYDCLYEITNTPLLKLPTTGSSGIWKYGFIGISMIAVLTGGIVVYETRNKKKRRRHHKKS